MQTQSAPIEITRRFSCVNTSKEQRVKSETIAQQVAEYEARGGKITPVAIGVSALVPGELFVSSDKESIATPRLCKAAKKATKQRSVTPAKAQRINGLMILGDAAKFMGVSTNTIGKWIEKQLIEVVTQTGGNSRAKYVRKSDLTALKKSLELDKNEKQKTLINMKQAAAILGVNPVTITKWVNKGLLKIDRLDLTGKRSKLIKTSDVLALKESLEQGNI